MATSKVEALAADVQNLSPEGQATVGAVLDAMANTKPTEDIFAWANNLMADREEYDIQLFYFSKNGVIHSLNNAATIKDRLRVLFLDSMMESVLDLAEIGDPVRKYEETVKGDQCIAWLALEKVAKAHNVVLWLQDHPSEVERFNEAEHSLKRQIGIFAAFTHKKKPPFYIFKSFDAGHANIGDKDFVMNGDSVEMLRADAAFRIDETPQVLVIGSDVFVFKQAKFEKLFDMKPHQIAVANKNGAIIDERFNLTMPLIVKEVGILAQTSPSAVKRLSEVDPYFMSPDEVTEAIDEFKVDLMIDDAGAIILQDAKDLIRFLDVLSDNYVHGSSGADYLAKSKKLLQTED